MSGRRKLVPKSLKSPVETIIAAPTDPLRDEIAVRVMSTLISDAQAFVGEVTKSDMHARMSFSNVASISYGMADAMMEARKK